VADVGEELRPDPRGLDRHVLRPAQFLLLASLVGHVANDEDRLPDHPVPLGKRGGADQDRAQLATSRPQRDLVGRRQAQPAATQLVFHGRAVLGLDVLDRIRPDQLRDGQTDDRPRGRVREGDRPVVLDDEQAVHHRLDEGPQGPLPLLERFLRRLLRGDIELPRHEEGDLPGLVEYRDDRRLLPEQLAVLPPIAELSLPAAALAQGLPQPLVELRRMDPRLQDGRGLPQHLFPLVPAHPGEPAVDVEDPPITVGDDHGRRQEVERPLQEGDARVLPLPDDGHVLVGPLHRPPPASFPTPMAATRQRPSTARKRVSGSRGFER